MLAKLINAVQPKLLLPLDWLYFRYADYIKNAGKVKNKNIPRIFKKSRVQVSWIASIIQLLTIGVMFPPFGE